MDNVTEPAFAVLGRVVLFSGYSMLGFLMRNSFKVFTKRDGLVMLRFVVNVTLPALLITTLTETIIGNSIQLLPPTTALTAATANTLTMITNAPTALTSASSSSLVTTVPLIFCSIFASLSMMGSALYLYSKRPSNERGLFVGAMAGVNLGTYSYPFIEAIWGSEGLRIATLYDLPNSIFVFVISSMVFSYERSKQKKGENVELKHDDGGIYSGEFITERVKKETYAKRSSTNANDDVVEQMSKKEFEKEFNEGEGKQKTTYTQTLVKNGLGIYTYPSGASYEGEWGQNMKNGLGVYKYAKGGSYVGNFKSGEFSGFGVRKLRSGLVKCGIWKANELEKIVPMEELAQTVRDATIIAAKAKVKVNSLKEETFMKRIVNILKFPPFIALAVVFISNFVVGHSLPAVIHKLAEPLANANNPLVLITVGVLFEANLRRQQTRDCVGFLAAKYATGLACAAVVSIFIPNTFPIARGTLAALCVMPVPSVVVQQAVKNNLDADLAASLVSGSQIASVIMLLFFAATMNLASRPFLFPFSLLLLAGLVSSIGYFMDEYLSPSKSNATTTTVTTTLKAMIMDKIDKVFSFSSFKNKSATTTNQTENDSDNNDNKNNKKKRGPSPPQAFMYSSSSSSSSSSRAVLGDAATPFNSSQSSSSRRRYRSKRQQQQQTRIYTTRTMTAVRVNASSRDTKERRRTSSLKSSSSFDVRKIRSRMNCTMVAARASISCYV